MEQGRKYTYLTVYISIYMYNCFYYLISRGPPENCKRILIGIIRVLSGTSRAQHLLSETRWRSGGGIGQRTQVSACHESAADVFFVRRARMWAPAGDLLRGLHYTASHPALRPETGGYTGRMWAASAGQRRRDAAANREREIGGGGGGGRREGRKRTEMIITLLYICILF